MKFEDSERKAAIAILREVCEEFGDNDWSDNLHLADIIEKHLARYLWEKIDREHEKDMKHD